MRLEHFMLAFVSTLSANRNKKKQNLLWVLGLYPVQQIPTRYVNCTTVTSYLYSAFSVSLINLVIYRILLSL